MVKVDVAKSSFKAVEWGEATKEPPRRLTNLQIEAIALQHGYELQTPVKQSETSSLFRAKKHMGSGKMDVALKVLHKVNESNHRLVKAIREVSITSSLSVSQNKHAQSWIPSLLDVIIPKQDLARKNVGTVILVMDYI